MLLNVTADVTKNSNGEILSEENCTSKTKQQTWQINLAVLMSEVINVSLYAFTAINLKAFLVTSSFGLTKQERKNYSSGERRKKGTSGFLYQYDLALFRVVALVICIFFFCLAQLQRQKWNKSCLALQMITKAFWMIRCTKPWVYQTLQFLNGLCFLLSTSVIFFTAPNRSDTLLICNIG